MNTQLDVGAGQALGRLIEAKGFTVHGGVFPSKSSPTTAARSPAC